MQPKSVPVFFHFSSDFFLLLDIEIVIIILWLIAFGTLGILNLNQDVQIRTASDAIKTVQLWLNKKDRVW